MAAIIKSSTVGGTSTMGEVSAHGGAASLAGERRKGVDILPLVVITLGVALSLVWTGGLLSLLVLWLI